jgi:hypothetical protein
LINPDKFDFKIQKIDNVNIEKWGSKCLSLNTQKK